VSGELESKTPLMVGCAFLEEGEIFAQFTRQKDIGITWLYRTNITSSHSHPSSIHKSTNLHPFPYLYNLARLLLIINMALIIMVFNAHGSLPMLLAFPLCLSFHVSKLTSLQL
jgi:hypothetical protein